VEIPLLACSRQIAEPLPSNDRLFWLRYPSFQASCHNDIENNEMKINVPKELANEPILESEESSQRPPALFPQDRFNTILPSKFKISYLFLYCMYFC
jgi:hypothetical protein